MHVTAGHALQYVDDTEEVFNALNEHDVVVVTAVPHAMDGSEGFLLPPYTVFAYPHSQVCQEQF
jgi:hypothetical protein